MKIAYFGLPLGACLLGEAGYEPSLVVLSPIAAPGRRRLARSLPGAHVVDFLRGGLAEKVDLAFESVRPELLLSWFWTRRLPERWLVRPSLGAFGVHPSLLPRHRGPDPYFAAIDAGDAVTGVTLHRLEPEYDVGDIVASESLPIGELNAWQLARALDRPSLRLLLWAASQAASGLPLRGQPQSAEHATWAGEPVGDQLRVRWEWTNERVLRRIRALAPTPGLALELRGLEFFVTSATAAPTPELPLRAGEAVVREFVTIRTGDGAIRAQSALVVGSEGAVDGRALAKLLAERGAGPQGVEKPNGGES